ncbi:MAG: S-layer homology domain-containing protein [Candidatus Gracilibacteria bacterium]|jgi:hypothetical protein
MRKFLVLSALTLALTLTLATSIQLAKTALASSCTSPFTDIEDSFAEDDICFLYQHGILNGKSEHSFYPNDTITRAEFLKIVLLDASYQVYPVQSASFTDISGGDWYYRYVTFAHSKGFVEGYSDGSFHPNSQITRAESVQMLLNISGITNFDTSEANTSFSDVDDNDWYASAVAMALEFDIIEGYGDGSFRPNNNLTRAEAATMAARMWRYLYGS